MIKYIGSKRLLVPWIADTIEALAPGPRVLDLFSGTSRVGHELKRRGLRVVANDHNAYAATLARCYVQADAEDVADDAGALLEELGRVPPVDGYVTETFCRRSRFFHPRNGARIDGIRDAIAARDLPPELEAVALTALMEAADRVDSSTVGVQMAYLKSWAARALNDLQLRMPEVLARAAAGKGTALCLDAVEAAASPVDIAYLDPPYNQHKYVGNYHVWETLVRWDAPEVYGVACKRVDVRERHSPFNSRVRIEAGLEAVLDALTCSVVVLSFNDEGAVSPERMRAILGARGHVLALSKPHPRYVGARIGIYDPSGRKVGTPGRLMNREWLYVLTQEPLAPDLRARLEAVCATSEVIRA